jgi:hypothetical protein
MFDSIVRKLAIKSRPINSKAANEPVKLNKQSISFNNQSNSVMIELLDLNKANSCNDIINTKCANCNCKKNIQIIYLNDSNNNNNRTSLNDTKMNQTNEVHIYEEIQEMKNNQNLGPKTFIVNENLAHQTYTHSGPFSQSSLTNGKNKKSVRFKAGQQFQMQQCQSTLTNNHEPYISSASSCSTSSCSSTSSFNSILKKSANHPVLTLDSQNLTKDTLMYLQSVNPTTYNSTHETSVPHEHSVAFNQLVQGFLNKLNTNNYYSNTSNTSTNSTSSKNSEIVCEPKLDAEKLSFRVTNLTLDDLKQRQRSLTNIRKGRTKNASHLNHSSFNSFDSNHSSGSTTASLSSNSSICLSSGPSRPVSNYFNY